MEPSVVHTLALQSFRSFETRSVSFDDRQTLILGKNGIGKTNILEALTLLSVGNSFRGKRLGECVRLGCEAAHIGVSATIDGEEEKLQMSIAAIGTTLGAQTRYLRNGVKKRKGDVVGILKTVVFRPEDVELVTGSPGAKREWLDSVLVQVSKPYQVALHEYEKALRHRNKLIVLLREGLATRRDFIFWDELLIRHGDVITRERARFMHCVNDFVQFPVRSTVTYTPSLMTQERLHSHAVAEVAAGKTLVGPHKDDFTLTMELSQGQFQEVGSFGSRGQQRLAVVWLKIAQLQFIERETRIVPILLLDDLFSELDEVNRSILFPLFADHQVILTSAEPLDVLPPGAKDGAIVQL